MGLAKDELGQLLRRHRRRRGRRPDADRAGRRHAPTRHREAASSSTQTAARSLEIDSDAAREKADAESEPVINPMTAATSRLAHHGGRLALLHGINTGYDADVDARHQKALTTHFDAMTGAVTRTSTMWVSHSFDQRLFWDGCGLHRAAPGRRLSARHRARSLLAMPRTAPDTYELFKPKGETGANNTYTRLGGIAPIAAGDFGYVVVFTTERGTRNRRNPERHARPGFPAREPRFRRHGRRGLGVRRR